MHATRNLDADERARGTTRVVYGGAIGKRDTASWSLNDDDGGAGLKVRKMFVIVQTWCTDAMDFER